MPLDPKARSRFLVAALFVVLLGALGLYYGRGALGPVDGPQPAPVAAHPTPRPAPTAPTPAAPPKPPTADDAVSALLDGAHATLPPSAGKFASPEEARAFVHRHVVELLATIAPEIKPADLQEQCSDDGRVCKYVAPWPSDDLMKHWLQAIVDNRTGPEQLEGVKFAHFGKGTRDGKTELQIEAHAP